MADSSVNETSLSLLDRVRSRDEVAWRRFVQLYSPLVYSWAKRSGLRNQDAADVLQDVFHAVAKSLSQFRVDVSGSFRGWLWVIPRNKIHDFHRERIAVPVGGSEMRERIENIPEHEPESWSVADDCSPANLVRRATELIRDDFEPKTWQAFWRLAVESQPARDIAESLGMNVDAVYQAKARVLKRLKEELRGLDS